jgi:epoxyqueuosine reductase
MVENIENIQAWIESSIIEFVNNSIQNSLGGSMSERAWESPLVGFSKGDDELYYNLKEDIGEFLWTPQEIFLKAYPELKVQSNELSVVSWILPQTEKTKIEQRYDSINPSERAVLARTNGENFNRKIGEFLVDLFENKGIKAVAPGQCSFWENRKSEKYGFASTWSERHVAYISGLGTFSLTDALITQLGTAVRIGSVVVNTFVESTKRKYTKYNEYCLFYSKGSCMKCAKRCPANAIDENGHDKVKCRMYQRNIASKHTKEKYNIDSNYCGICLFGTPCESRIPK